MSRRIYTYKSLRELDRHPRYLELIDYPHITATWDLYQAVQGAYAALPLVLDIHALQGAIFGTWEDQASSLQQFLDISRVLRDLPVQEEERAVYQSFVKNKAQALNAIRLLVEADVKPEDIVPDCVEETLFQRVWTELEKVNGSFSGLREAMERYLADPEGLEAALAEVAPELAGDTIVLHGFYFITPIQERIFDLLENCGKDLIFLCCIDKTVPAVEEIWYKALSPDNKFDPPELWQSDEMDSLRNRPFGAAFNGEPALKRQYHISILRYNGETDFVRDVQRLLDEKFTIYSVDMKATDELLKEFYPSVYQRRRLLSYPAGQYIYRLHAMWDPATERLKMTFDDVQACFALGWVEVNGANGLKYMSTLKAIETYVSDCRTLEDWEERLALLKRAKEELCGPFEAHLDRVPPEDRRWHRVMADPFLNLSCFGPDREELDTLIGLIGHLMDTARALFTGPGEVAVADHMAKVRKILEAGKEDAALLEEESAIVDELIAQLQYPNAKGSTCLPGEIAEAIRMIVSGGIVDEENYSSLSGRTGSLVKPLYQAESAPLTGNGKVHLCLCDERRLPGGVRPYVWPLSGDFLDRLNIPAGQRRRQYLSDMRFILENAPLADRYLFFSLLQNLRVEVSWIGTEGEREALASPYLQILEQTFQVPVERVEKKLWTPEGVEEIAGVEKRAALRIDLDRDMAPEAKLDAALCPRRYLYGYVLSELPAYTSGFHYDLALIELVGTLAEVGGKSKWPVGKALLANFPYLREVEKQQILDQAWASGIEGTDTLDGVAYPKARLAVHYLRDEFWKQEEEELGDRKICMYCPYQAVCPRVVNQESGKDEPGKGGQEDGDE